MHQLIPVLLPFAAGIIFSYRTGVSYEAALLMLAVSSMPVLISYMAKRRFRHIITIPLFFSIGTLFIIPYLKPDLPPEHIINFVDKAGREDLEKSGGLGALGTAIEGEVLALPEFAGPRTRLRIGAIRALKGDEWRDATGEVLLTLEGNVDRFKAGDHVRFITRLKEPRNYGNPGEFDYKASLNLKGIFATGYVRKERLITKIKDREPGALRHIDDMREGIRGFIDRSRAKNKESLKALIIAEKGGIDNSLKEAFIKTGTAHILAISGLHVGVVALFFYRAILFVLKRSERLILAFNIKKAAMALSLMPVLAYGALAGFPVSTRRAVAMVAVFVITFMMNRGKDFLNTLALAALLILILTPYSLWDISFQLTFAAVFSIIYLVPRLEGFFEKKEEEAKLNHLKENRFLHGVKGVWTERIRPAALVTIAAGLGTSPILAYHFHRVSLAGSAANLIVVPLTGVVVPLLLISSSIFPFWEGLAGVVLGASDAVFTLLAWVVRSFAALPYSSSWVATPTVLEISLIYGLIISAANIKKSNYYKILVPVFLIVISADWGYWNYLNDNGELKVTFISVGQGESELIEFPGGETMLIDGGGHYNSSFDTGEGIIAPFLWHKKIKKIDYIVLSHAQLDHMGGLKFIAENFNVKEFWWNGDGRLGRLNDAVSKGNIKVKVLDGTSEKISLSGVTVQILHPFNGLGFDQNNMCLVLKLTYGEKSFLFTGDIGADAEGELLKRDISATVLKAPHHGSRYSSSMEFLKKVSPSIVVVSAGYGNVFHFPHEESMARYGEAGARVYRTDLNGAVTIKTDGKRLVASPYLTEGAR